MGAQGSLINELAIIKMQLILILLLVPSHFVLEIGRQRAVITYTELPLSSPLLISPYLLLPFALSPSLFLALSKCVTWKFKRCQVTFFI